MGLDHRVRCCPDGLVTDRRRRIKVLDCTIRDGGICNNWNFKNNTITRVFSSLIEAGVDYMEVGYKTSTPIFLRCSTTFLPTIPDPPVTNIVSIIKSPLI